MHNLTFFCLKKKPNQCIVDIWGSMLYKSNKSSGRVFSVFYIIYYIIYIYYIYSIKIWHAALNNGINLLKIIVINNRNYNIKGIIDNYDFCHNRAALTAVISECHIAYNTVSQVYYFYILGGVKFTYVVSTTRCIYTCPVSSGMRPRPPPEVFWAIGFILQNAWSDQV